MTGQWVQQTTMARVYLRNKPAHSAHVSQNLKYNNNNFKKEFHSQKGGEFFVLAFLLQILEIYLYFIFYSIIEKKKNLF